MRTLATVLLACSLTSLIVACGDDDGSSPDAASDASADAASDVGADATAAGPIMLRFDLSDEAGLYDHPFPLEVLRGTDGRPRLDGWPNPRNLDLIDAFIETITTETDGFSPTGPIYFPFDGPIDASALPGDPATYRDDPASPIVLVDIDPDSPRRGQRVPLIVDYTGDGERLDSYRPDHVLQILPAPGFNLREHTRYGVIVTGLTSADPARPLIQHPTLTALLAGETPDAPLGAELASEFAALREWVAAEGIEPGSIVAATVYRTGDVTSRLYALAEWARAQAAPTPSQEPQPIFEMDEYCAYQGEWIAPQYQDGTPPYTDGGGRLILDADGEPVEQRTETVPFVLAVPKGVMPAEGFPLLFYVNGTGGLARQVLDRGRKVGSDPPPEGTGPAQVAAARGYGASGMAGILTEERLTDSSGGYLFYNFFNPVAMRDNFRQSLIEHILFRKLVLNLRLDPSTCPGVDASAAADGMVRYDGSQRVVMGQSLGSYLSGMLATIDPGWRGAILTGAGGSWVEFPFGARSPNLEQLARTVLSVPATRPFDRWHPGLALFDWAVGPSDNTHYVDEILRDPTREGRRPAFDPPHVLVIEGDDDDNISTGLQRALNAALGTDLAGDDVGAPDDRILPWLELAGRGALPPPVRGNRATAAGPRTAAVVRWLPDVDDGGHYVTFQLDGPKHQYGCFLETLRTDPEGVPKVIAGTTVDGPCD